MRKIIFAILLISVLLVSGCVPGMGSMKKSSANYDKQTSEDAFEREGTERLTMKTDSGEVEVVIDEDEETVTLKKTGEDSITIKTTGDDSVTFEKLPDYTREKDLSEKCDLDFPFECSEYQAHDGVIYLAIKNQDYNSKFFDVTLSLSGESCDPVETEIEPGQNKDFECYVDPDADYAMGELEIEYDSNIYDEIRVRSGMLVVEME